VRRPSRNTEASSNGCESRPIRPARQVGSEPCDGHAGERAEAGRQRARRCVRYASDRAVRSQPRNMIPVPSVQGVSSLEDHVVDHHPMAQDGDGLGGVSVHGAFEEDDPVTWAAARLVTVPAGASPAGGGCPAAIVVISGGGKGDRPAGSPEVKVSGSDREASNLAGCSGSETGSPEILGPTRSDCGGSRECRALLRWVKAVVVNGIAGCNSVDKLSGVLEDDMPRRNRERKPGTTRGSLRRSRTAKAARINRDPVKSCCACEWDGWGRLSEDGAGQNNPNPSEDPWGGAMRVARTAVCDRIQPPDADQTELRVTKHTKDEDKPSGETSMPGAGLIRTSFREGLV
jgi:hypothetical protein